MKEDIKKSRLNVNHEYEMSFTQFLLTLFL